MAVPCCMGQNVGQPRTTKPQNECSYETMMGMLRWISGKTRNDRIKNECNHGNLGVAPIGENIGKADSNGLVVYNKDQ